MNPRWRPRLRLFRGLGFGALLIILTGQWVHAQSTAVGRSSSRAETFDTTFPANYSLDYPGLPPEDPMSSIPLAPPPGIDVLINPETLDYRSALNSNVPSPSPADYNPEVSTRMADYSNTAQGMAALGNDVPSNSEIVISDYGHPIFYDLSRTTAAFGLDETPLVTDTPMIPEPGTSLDKPIAPRLKAGPWRMAFDVVASAAAVYNVQGSTTNPQNDMAYTFMPRFYLEAGTKGSFRIQYSPSFVRYSRFKDLNSANQNLSVNVAYPFSKLRVGSSFSYLTQSGLFLNNQEGQGESKTTMATLSASYPFTTKINATLGWMGVIQDNQPGGKQTENALTLNVNYGKGSKMMGGTVIQVGNVDAPGGKQNYITLQGEMNYRYDFHWRYSARAGVNYRILNPAPYDTPDPLITPVFDLTGSYHWTSNAAAVLRLYRYVGTDTFSSVNLNIQTGAELGLLLRAYRKTDVKFLLAFGYSELFANTEDGSSNFSFVQGGFSVSYTVVKLMDVVFFGNVQQRFADSQGLNYLSGTLGVGIYLRF